MTQAAQQPGVNHLELLPQQSTSQIVSYLIVDDSDDHWLPVRRRRDGQLVDSTGRPLDFVE